MKYLFLTLGIILYFLPTFVGTGKRNINAIFTLNLLLGWSVIGWIVAMVWATTVEAPVTLAAKPVVSPPASVAVPLAHTPESMTLEARTTRLKHLRDNGTLSQEEFMDQINRLS